METNILDRSVFWRAPWHWWAVITVLSIVIVVIFQSVLEYTVYVWDNQEEYSYGYLVPVISLFLIWQRKNELMSLLFNGSWYGLLLVSLGVGLYLVGEMSTVYTLAQYSFVIVILGVALTLTGVRGFKLVAIPLLILLFMIPLPNFILQNLSAQLQLLSSQIGVLFIKLFDISVNLEGNVIDLGSYKLQVVEACSGLRYLFPLMVFGFIAAYLYRVEMWKRVVVFLSTIPITILMNSFRIGLIGITVEYLGIEMAEGFLHSFEGWLIFMACTGVLALEMWVLTKMGRNHWRLRDVFGVQFPGPIPKNAEIRYRSLPKPLWGAAALLLITTLVSLSLPHREEIIPAREDFITFPSSFEDWQGRTEKLEKMYIDELKFDDYIMANYTGAANLPVNFYVAYYGSQRKGESAHSPRSCIPAGGWRITSLTRESVDGIKVGDIPLNVNRVVVQKNDHTQLVYYWFQQRGRVITNEYMVKWYLFWDALTKNRTDGALIRVTTVIDGDKNISQADSVLESFVKAASSRIERHIPG